MPAPLRVTTDEIVAAACELLEAGGPERLTMQAVADRVGVRAPSLYKRVPDRDGLLALAAAATLAALQARLRAAAAAGGPADALRALARTVRAFAHERPEGFRLVFAPGAAGPELPVGALAAAAQPLLDATARLVGEHDALPAARTVTAWATGFLLMELAGAFRLGGDVGTAFEWGLDRLIAALAAPGAPDRR